MKKSSKTRSSSGLFAACLFLLTLSAASAQARAGDVYTLEQSIQEVIAQPEYTWRMPRERPSQEEELGIFASFLRDVGETLWTWTESAARWVARIIRKIIDRLPEPPGVPRRSFSFWQSGNQWLLFLLLAVLLSALAVFLLRMKRSSNALVALGEAVPATPDLEKEDVGADELPTDGWLGLAEELMAKGELRLALRALYLGSLSFLAEQQLIHIAKFKSNRDYRSELDRRAHSLPDVCSAFSENVSLFDASWYGMREVTEGVLTRFRNNWERIQSLEST